jgi:hypothetical protein
MSAMPTLYKERPEGNLAAVKIQASYSAVNRKKAHLGFSWITQKEEEESGDNIPFAGILCGTRCW